MSGGAAQVHPVVDEVVDLVVPMLMYHSGNVTPAGLDVKLKCHPLRCEGHVSMLEVHTNPHRA